MCQDLCFVTDINIRELQFTTAFTGRVPMTLQEGQTTALSHKMFMKMFSLIYQSDIWTDVGYENEPQGLLIQLLLLKLPLEGSYHHHGSLRVSAFR